ncbi:hypothetical protein [Pseudonocardia sp.]|uniref:hypothetical protein n=1 Tax=Pseudonocardia sp. TaxID=60912 RepID=UPI0031FBEE81
MLATEFGVVRDANDPAKRGYAETRRTSARPWTSRSPGWGMDHIDLYYQHRDDPERADRGDGRDDASLVEQGKVRYLGLSEASAPRGSGAQ